MIYILKAGYTWNKVNIIKYIVNLCEKNSKGIQFKYLDFLETCVNISVKTYQTKGP